VVSGIILSLCINVIQIRITYNGANKACGRFGGHSRENQASENPAIPYYIKPKGVYIGVEIHIYLKNLTL